MRVSRLRPHRRRLPLRSRRAGLVRRSRRSPLALRQSLRPALAPLSIAELWVLASLFGARDAQMHLDEVEDVARRGGAGLTLRAIAEAAAELRRRGLCLRHGHHHERVSLTPAGRIVAALEADHLAPATTPRLAARGVEVWRCVRAQGAAVAAGGGR